MDGLGLTEIIWVDDPSKLVFWVDDPARVGDPEEVEDDFLVDNSGRASLDPFPVPRPPRKEAPDALGGITVFL